MERFSNWITTSGADGFYLTHQILASSLICLVGMGAGLIIAWLCWGRNRGRVRAVRNRIGKLKEQLGEERP